MPDRYRGSPKHKHPWERGRSGSQCGDADGHALFEDAVAHPDRPRQRYATDGRFWYRALPDDNPGADGGMTWHGHPVLARDVPKKVQDVFVARGVIVRSSLTRVVPVTP